jgi:hypothetical protein
MAWRAITLEIVEDREELSTAFGVVGDVREGVPVKVTLGI